MALIMRVAVATGTSIEKAAEELTALAELTRCVVVVDDFQGLLLAISPGEPPGQVEKHIMGRMEMPK